MMNEALRKRIEEFETIAQHSSGLGLVEKGMCPIGATLSIYCTTCPNGHLLECHYPMTCKEAKCSHYLAYKEIDG